MLGIESYYGKLNREDVANRKVQAIISAVRQLRQHRYGNRINNELTPDYRRMLVEDYVVYYQVDEQAQIVFVYEVRHSARKPLKSETHRRRASRRDNFEV